MNDERKIAILEIITNSAVEIVKHISDNDFEAAYYVSEISKAQVGAIMAQPDIPQDSPGGVIVTKNTEPKEPPK